MDLYELALQAVDRSQAQEKEASIVGAVARGAGKLLAKGAGAAGKVATKHPWAALTGGLTGMEAHSGFKRGVSAGRVGGTNPFKPTMPQYLPATKVGGVMDPIDEMVQQGLLTQDQADAARERGTKLAAAALAVDPTMGLQYFEATEEPEKVAFNPLKNLKVDLSPVLGALALGAAADVGSRAFSAIAEPLMASRGYKAMLETNPGLQGQDAKRVQLAYNSLRTINPTYADDPAIAGTFVNQVLNYSTEPDQIPVQIDLGTANAVTSAGKNMAGMRSDNFLQKSLGRVSPGDILRMADPNAEAMQNARLLKDKTQQQYDAEMHQARLKTEKKRRFAEEERADSYARKNW